MTIDAFVKKYAGGIDYDGMYGKQCVDYVNAYARDVLGVKNAFYGQGIQYAYQVFANYEALPYVKEHFIRIANERTNYPLRGDVVVWNKSATSKYGHIAVVLGATEHTITVAEQNYDGKGSVRTYTYGNYNNVLGWMRARDAKPNKPTIQAGETVKLKCRAKLYNANSAQSGMRKISDFSKFDCAAEAVIKRGANFKADKVVTKANKNIWLYIKQYDGWICVYEYAGDKSKLA